MSTSKRTLHVRSLMRERYGGADLHTHQAFLARLEAERDADPIPFVLPSTPDDAALASRRRRLLGVVINEWESNCHDRRSL